MHTYNQGIRLDRPRGKLWWLPGALAALTGVLFFASAAYTEDYFSWGSVGALWVLLGAFLIRRRFHQPDSTA